MAESAPAQAVDTASPKATIRSAPPRNPVSPMHHIPATRKRTPSPAKPHRPRSGLWAAVAGLLVLLGGGLMFRETGEPAAPSSFTAVSASSSRHSAPADGAPKYATKPIRDFRGFEWVLARNPEVADEERSEFEEVDYRQWRWVELELTKPDGDLLKVGLGRPIAWLVVNDITPGATTWLDLPEMGAVGYATVVSVAPCPDPGPKPHPDCRLVTGVFRHSSADCVNVHVAGLASPIGTTRNHRFWSEDRQTFVEAGQLHPGETLLTADGTPTSVLSVAERPSSEPVYNLEVDVEHVYYVSADGLLVHNTCGRVEQGRNALGRFVRRQLGDVPPGSLAVDDFIRQARASGFEVAGTNVAVRTPFGMRYHDVVLRHRRTQALTAVEIKSSRSAFRRFDAPARQQFAADRWVNKYGEWGLGDHAKLFIKNVIKILWE